LARSRFKLEFATTPDAGIEVAGEMNDFLRESVRYYDRIDLQDFGVTALEHGSRILPRCRRRWSAFAERKMTTQGDLTDISLERTKRRGSDE
jgi:NADH dehydrogenase FAD-containing subunit